MLFKFQGTWSKKEIYWEQGKKRKIKLGTREKKLPLWYFREQRTLTRIEIYYIYIFREQGNTREYCWEQGNTTLRGRPSQIVFLATKSLFCSSSTGLTTVHQMVRQKVQQPASEFQASSPAGRSEQICSFWLSLFGPNLTPSAARLLFKFCFA